MNDDETIKKQGLKIRRFVMDNRKQVLGEGVRFSDGTTVMRWFEQQAVFIFKDDEDLGFGPEQEWGIRYIDPREKARENRATQDPEIIQEEERMVTRDICYGCETWKETSDDKWRHMCARCRAKHENPGRRVLLGAYAFSLQHDMPVEALEDLLKVRKQSAKRIAEIEAETPQKESLLRAYAERHLSDVRDAAQAVLDILNLTHRERNESLDEDQQIEHWLDSQLANERLCGEFAARFMESGRRCNVTFGDFLVEMIICLSEDAEVHNGRRSVRLRSHEQWQLTNMWVMFVEAYMQEVEPGAIR